MKRAVVSPLCSLVVPGLGQLINRQAGKGAVLVMGSGLIFMGVFGLFVYKLSQAGNQIAQLPPAQQTMQALSRALWEQGVAGLAVATRPDCLPPGVVEYLAELHQRTFLWVELGLQTVHEATAAQMNRGHGYGAYLEGLAALRRHGIRVCVHIINGLPGESPAMMRATARAVAAQDVQGIKIHLLHVMEGTPLGERYRRAPFPLLEQDVYVALVCDQLELLPPGMVIHRLTGDAPRDTLLGPAWSVNKWEVLNAIDWELERRGTWQGCRAASPPPSARP